MSCFAFLFTLCPYIAISSVSVRYKGLYTLLSLCDYIIGEPDRTPCRVFVITADNVPNRMFRHIFPRTVWMLGGFGCVYISQGTKQKNIETKSFSHSKRWLPISPPTVCLTTQKTARTAEETCTTLLDLLLIAVRWTFAHHSTYSSITSTSLHPRPPPPPHPPCATPPV